MKTQLLQNEQLIKEGGANLQKGLETVGGKLYLTNMRLIYESHALNFQIGSEVINLTAIQSTKLGWTRVLGFIPGFPNALVVIADNREYRFTVFGRKEWLQSINSLLTAK